MGKPRLCPIGAAVIQSKAREALNPPARILWWMSVASRPVERCRLSISTKAKRRPRSQQGFIPTGWYPGALVNDGRFLYIANVKGLGSRNPRTDKKGWNSHMYLGTVTKVEVPTGQTLKQYTQTVNLDARVPQILRAWEKS